MPFEWTVWGAGEAYAGHGGGGPGLHVRLAWRRSWGVEWVAAMPGAREGALLCIAADGALGAVSELMQAAAVVGGQTNKHCRW